MRALLVPALVLASPAMAQDHSHHGEHDAAPPVAAPAKEAEPADPHAGHAMPAPEPDIGNASSPAPPADHAADAVHDPAVMAKARAALRTEGGGMTLGMVLIDRAELQVRDGRDRFRLSGEAWFGGDIDRLKLKAETEGEWRGPLETVEVQALYTRALDPWWNVQAGIRHDIRPDPSRTYAVLGIEGVAPYWFHVEGALFLSDKGDVHLRGEASLDQRITQRLIIQPRVEGNLAFQKVPALGLGSGLTDFELGARLRYEIKPEFAPYIGFEWHRKTGGTARLARLAGEDVSSVSAVAGIRLWF